MLFIGNGCIEVVGQVCEDVQTGYRYVYMFLAIILNPNYSFIMKQSDRFDHKTANSPSLYTFLFQVPISLIFFYSSPEFVARPEVKGDLGVTQK